MIILTTTDSSKSIAAEEDACDVVIYVDNQRMQSIQSAAITAGIDEIELWSELLGRGLPAYRFESDMLAKYAADYWLAAEQLCSSQFFKPPFLFSLGHAFELVMKAVLVYSQRIRIDSVRRQYGHDLNELWKSASKHLSGATLTSTAALIADYSKVYDGQMVDAKFFVRYPDRSHIYGKWPESIVESVNAVANDASLIIGWLNSEFRGRGWQYTEWPNKAVNWTP